MSGFHKSWQHVNDDRQMFHHLHLKGMKEIFYLSI